MGRLSIRNLLQPQDQHAGHIVFTQKPVRGSWGGSNQFVKQMESLLTSRGYQIAYDLEGKVDLIVIIDPRTAKNKPIGYEKILAYKDNHPDVPILHRINECDLRKGTDFMDALLERTNKAADYTVFISNWLREYHSNKWFDLARPNSVIYNGADPAVFHPSVQNTHKCSTLRLVTHHWGASYTKGYDVYEKLDQAIAKGVVNNVSLRVIGRWPDGIRWKAAETFPPTQGKALADKLRECDAYITASRWEPCGMHQVEGIQCGLPLLYHRDGGGIVEAGRRCGIEFTDDWVDAIETLRANFRMYREKAIGLDLGGDKMCMEFAHLIRKLLFGAR